MNYRGKKAFIVGGSSGIGLSVAKMLAAKGAEVMIFARGQSGLDLALQEISGRVMDSVQRFRAMALDVSDLPAVNEVMNQAISEFGIPDILINCAGRAHPHHFEAIDADGFDATLKINLYGTRHTVAALVPHMKTKGRGYIVNVSSVAGLIGVYGYTDYCASKFAVIGFSQALRSELRPHGLMVSVLCPPDTNTPGFDIENQTKPDETKAVSGNIKPLEPDQVAGALLKGLAGGKFLIIPGLTAKLTYLAVKFLPGLVEWLGDKQVAKVQSHRIRS
jgi:short-subunit dehydrogenase